LFSFCDGRLPLGPVANADAQRLVSVYADGEKRVFATATGTVADVLARAGVVLGPNDIVEPPAGTDVTKHFFNINVYRARPVTVQDGERTYHIVSAFQNPHLLADQAGLKLYPEDTYKVEMISDIVSEQAIGVKVTVIRAVPLTVRVDGQSRAIRTQAKTVGDALQGAGISLGLQDSVSPALDSPVVSGMKVRIVRVAIADTTVTEQLKRNERTVDDPTILWGQRQVQQEGSDGYRKVSYRLHYRDGVVVQRELLKVVEQVNPTERVELVGTKVPYVGPADRAATMRAAGIDDADFGYADYIIQHESGWVVTRANVAGSGAYGLGQALPANKMAAFGADYITNPITQLKWANFYAVDHHGSWANAYDYWRKHSNW
jgi:uncharacterized protein YabE (DUF348 family)